MKVNSVILGFKKATKQHCLSVGAYIHTVVIRWIRTVKAETLLILVNLSNSISMQIVS